MDGLIWVLIATAAGGVLKGATGAGVPILGVPILAMLYDVRVAVTVFAVVNLMSNLWQGWSYRRTPLSRRFVAIFAAAGLAGTAMGTVMLASLRPEALQLITAGAVSTYIAFRLARPHWRLASAAAHRLALPVGLVAGVLQGTTGISAPVSLSFMNAMRLDRPQFIVTISIFFAAMALVQIPMLVVYGLMTWQLAGWGVAGFAVVLAGMALGERLVRHISAVVFDRIILALLAVLALRLVWSALA